MSKYLDQNGLSYFWGKLKAYFQSKLVSGTNIKTVNGNSLLGSGDLTIQGGGDKNVWYGTCSTVAGNSTKVITTTTGDFTLGSGGEIIVVYFDYPVPPTALSSLEFEIDGSGPFAVRADPQDMWDSGDVLSFVYDADENNFIHINTRPATTSFFGVTKLSNSVASTSEGMAATPSAVKQAYDLAAANASTVTQVSITVANWNATTTCTKSVTGVTASNSIIVSPAPASISDYVSAGVYCSAQASGTLTFECTSTPTADLVVNVMIVG